MAIAPPYVRSQARSSQNPARNRSDYTAITLSFPFRSRELAYNEGLMRVTGLDLTASNYPSSPKAGYA